MRFLVLFLVLFNDLLFSVQLEPCSYDNKALVFDYEFDDAYDVGSIGVPDEYYSCNSGNMYHYTAISKRLNCSDLSPYENGDCRRYHVEYYKVVDNCPDGQRLNSETSICEDIPDNNTSDSNTTSSCEPLSDYKINLSEESCAGSRVSDYDRGIVGLATWNSCDSSCYLLEVSFFSCNDIYKKKISSCSTATNNINWYCSQTSLDVPANFSFECKPKNDDNGSNPCLQIKQDFFAKCEAPKVVSGDCTYDSESKIVHNTLTCSTPDPDRSPCEIARENLLKTCTPPNYIAGTCVDAYDEIIGQNTLHCVEPDNDNSDDSSDSSDSNNSSNNIENNISVKVDINSSAITAPIIASNNQNTKEIITHLDRIEKNSRNTNDKFDSIDSKLSTLISANGRSLNDLKARFDTSNSFLGSVVSNTADISKNIDETNKLLKGIKDDLNVDANNVSITGVYSDLGSKLDSLNLDDSGLDLNQTFYDDIVLGISELKDDALEIKDQFEDTKDLISNGFSNVRVPAGSCSDPNLTKFGGYLARFSAPIALFVYISSLILIFKMVFLYFSSRSI